MWITGSNNGIVSSAMICRVEWDRTRIMIRQEIPKGHDKILCVREFIKTELATAVQRAFRLRFNIQPPTRENIRRWNHQFEQIGCLWTQKILYCIVPFCSQLTLLHGCALGECSSSGIWKFSTSSFNCYVDHSHTMYSSGNIGVWNWVHLFESPCICVCVCACVCVCVCVCVCACVSHTLQFC